MMGSIIGLAVAAIFIVVGVATQWFGLEPPLSYIVAFAGGLLCTTAIGPALANLAARR